MLKSRRSNIISNSKEEALKFKISKDNELTDIISSCIANNEFYSVKNKKKNHKSDFRFSTCKYRRRVFSIDTKYNSVFSFENTKK